MLITAMLIAGGLVYGFMPRAQPVDISEVKRAPLAVTVEEEGKTRVMERYQVTAPVAGYARSAFGRGQIIRRDPTGVLWGGSDPRADGCAIGF